MLDQFDHLVRSRRAVRHFKADPIPEGLLERLLDISRWAPSGYNLQPTHFVVATDGKIKSDLQKACLGQKQLIEAPATIVFTGDRHVYQNNMEQVIKLEIQVGAVSPAYADKARHSATLAFDQGPLGIGWLGRAFLPLGIKYFKPFPSIPAVQKRYWLTKQVMLSAMVFMLAAQAAGLATVPMEGFDERRVRRALNIPHSHIVPVVIPIGYADNRDLKKSRLPLAKMIHWNGWEGN